ncbi:glycosyltransferase family 4 protein [Thermincola ferriacetica]
MKIGINGQLLAGRRAGIGMYIYNLLRALQKVDSLNQYCIFMGQKSLQADLQKIFSEKFQPVCSRFPISGSWMRILWEQLVLPAQIKKASVDVMHYPDYALSVLSPFKPSVVTVHDLSFKLFPETFSMGKLLTKRTLITQSLQKAAQIIAVSENTKRDLVNLYGISPDKIHVVYNGVDHDLFKPVDRQKTKGFLRREYGLETGYILYVGTLEPRKNLVNLLRAYKLAREKFNISPQMVIAGSKGWLYKDIFKTVSDLGLNDSIVFTGYIPDDHLPFFYNGASVFVYPSIYEGFGLPPLEAMACGTPVVVSNVSSLPEVVGDAGVTVSPDDIEAMAANISKVLKDRTAASYYSKRGIERASLFTWETTALKTLKVYEQAYSMIEKRR